MQTVPPNPPSVSSRHGSHAAGTDTPAILELRIKSIFVGLYPPTPTVIMADADMDGAMTPGPTSPSTPSVCHLQGPLEEFVQYSRQEASKWLIDLAHDICDPDLTRGWLVVWKEPQQQWSRVAAADLLTASTYRYELEAGTTVGLSKISHRKNKSKTATTGNAATMREDVQVRDTEMCWVSGSPLSKNSHICPKRIGDHSARYIYKTYTGSLPPSGLTIYSPVFGLCLTHYLDAIFDVYELGFRFIDTNKYECHVFAPEREGCTYTIAGFFPPGPLANNPPLHGAIAAPPNPESALNPPAGLFRWHYLQCVLGKFAHSDYKGLQNIVFAELPIPIEGESDDYSTDSEFEWPSKASDLGRAAANDLREREERDEAVATWIESTSK